MVIRSEVKQTNLLLIYETCNRLFKNNKNCFYTKEQIEEMKTKKENIFLGVDQNGNWTS